MCENKTSRLPTVGLIGKTVSRNEILQAYSASQNRPQICHTEKQTRNKITCYIYNPVKEWNSLQPLQ